MSEAVAEAVRELTVEVRGLRADLVVVLQQMRPDGPVAQPMPPAFQHAQPAGASIALAPPPPGVPAEAPAPEVSSRERLLAEIQAARGSG